MNMLVKIKPKEKVTQFLLVYISIHKVDTQTT